MKKYFYLIFLFTTFASWAKAPDDESKFVKLCKAGDRNAVIAAKHILEYPSHAQLSRVDCESAQVLLIFNPSFTYSCLNEFGDVICTDKEKLTSLDWVEGQALTEIEVPGHKVADISALKGMETLNDVDISSTLVKSVKALDGLPNLTHLFVNDTQIEDVDSLTHLPKLWGLFANNVKPKITNEAIEHFVHGGESSMLELLYLANSDLINIDFSRQIHLNSLDISGSHVRDLLPLASQPLIICLSLNELNIKSLRELPEGLHAELIELNHNKLQNLEGIDRISAPEMYLELANNQIESLKGLQEGIELITLDLSGNRLESIDEISKIKLSERLSGDIDVSSNQISDLRPLKPLIMEVESREFPNVHFYIHGNPISYDECMSQLAPEVKHADAICSDLNDPPDVASKRALASKAKHKLYFAKQLKTIKDR